MNGHRVLWLGRFDSTQKSPEDALDILYRLLTKVPDAQLTMVGEVNEETLSRFSARAEELGLTEHLSFPGFSNDVFSEYEKADVFLITSNFEGYSMVIAESLACRVPIVCYEMPYLTLVRNSTALIQTPWKDFDAAADALAKILNDSELRHKMGESQRRRQGSGGA